MRTYSLRNVILFTTFILTSIDFFAKFAGLWRDHFLIEHAILLVLTLIAAVICSALTTHALLSLWQGTAFVKDMVDYGPDLN